MPVGLGLGRDHEPHYGRREGMVLMPYDPLWVGQLAGLWNRRQAHGVLAVQRQYSFRRQPEVTQRGKGVTTQTCFYLEGGGRKPGQWERARARVRQTWGFFMDVYSGEAYGRRVRALQGETSLQVFRILLFV